MGFEDRRQFPRFPCRFIAWVEGPRGPMKGTCTDLSLGGAFIDGVLLNVDAPTTMTIEFPGAKLVVQAQVRRASTQPKGVGVQFMRLEPQHLATLQRFVR
ncbi:MAG: PilZ domain-containing protein [Myxococcaceae bacterium]